MPIGTTRKPQALTRKNATPASSVLRQPLSGLAPDPASYMEYMPQRMGAPVPTTSPLSQGFSQAPSPQGLMGLTNHINGLVAQSQQQFQAGRNQSPVNWRYPTRSPLVRNPIANRQSWLAGQASMILAMQQAEEAGLGDIIPRSYGEMPFFAVRNRPEDVMAKFMATHVDGLRDKALSRVPSGPLTLRTPGGQMQQQMGYIDGQGQKTATNRLGALRQLALQNPKDADVMGALAAAENDFKAQMADRSSPATVAVNREKIAARNDAKRGRAQRQAEGLRNLFGRGPQSPLARKQAQPTPASNGLVSPLSRTVEGQTAAANRIVAATQSPHIAALGVDPNEGVVGVDAGIQRRLREDKNAEFSDDSLKSYQAWARDHMNISTPENDHFDFGDGIEGKMRRQAWESLARMPDNERARKQWWQEYLTISDRANAQINNNAMQRGLFTPDRDLGGM